MTGEGATSELLSMSHLLSPSQGESHGLIRKAVRFLDCKIPRCFCFVLFWAQIRSDQSLSRVQLFATPWIATRQAFLSITNSRSSLRLTSIESVMPSSHLILWRSSDPTKDWPRLAWECPRVSSGGMGWCWPASVLGALNLAVHAWDLLKEVAIVFISCTIVWSQVNNREGTSSTHQQKIGLKIYWGCPHWSEEDPVSPSVSLSHHEASISLSSFYIRGQTEWKPQSQKTNQTDHMDHSLA